MNPNRTIGIIGGGQLARMLATAAAELGFEINIYCPDQDCPAAQVANKTVLGNYDDNEKLIAFAKNINQRIRANKKQISAIKSIGRISNMKSKGTSKSKKASAEISLRCP